MANNSGKGFGFSIGGSGGGGSNTNVANADLTSDGNHTLDVEATTLTIDSSSTEIMKINGSTDKVVIGPSGADYTMPVTRGTDGYVITSDGSGAAAWEGSRIELEIQAYNDAIANGNFHYPVAMNNNKYPTFLSNDLGSTDVTTALSTSNVIRCSIYAMPRACTLVAIKGWGTLNGTESCSLELVKYSPVDGDSDNLAGVTLGRGTFTGGNANGVTQAMTGTIVSETTIAAGDLLMPMIRAVDNAAEKVMYCNATFVFQ